MSKEDRNMIVQHVRQSNQRIGTFVALKYNRKVRIGWSKCNRSAGDRFDSQTAIRIAVERAKKGTHTLEDAIPHSLLTLYPEFVARARKYFKVGKSASTKA